MSHTKDVEQPLFMAGRKAGERTSVQQIVVKETTMGWINRFRGSGKSELADPWSAATSNGAPYEVDKAIGSGSENAADPSGRPDASTLEEIKRRQVSLAVRYVSAVRAR